MATRSGCSASATPAACLIAAEIADRGPIPFRRFMELALYHPAVGYYTRPHSGPGPEADYVTSPETHAAFGGLLCAQLVEMWETMGRPSPFWLIEGGPGSGIFAADVLGAARAAFPDFDGALRVALIETSPVLRARQQARLAQWTGDEPSPSGRGKGKGSPRVRWIELSAVGQEPLGPGVLWANELLDAFPVHRLVGTTGGARERYVSVEDDWFVEIDGPLSRPELIRQIKDGGGRLSSGQTAEVNLAAPALVQSALSLLSRGYALLLDYGEPADVLYGPQHPRGTLRCYWRQTMSEDVFCRVGQQDMTAHVDLSAVTRVAAAVGAELVGATTQSSLLGRLGLLGLVEGLPGLGLRRVDEWAHRSALESLADPGGLGRLRALVLGKGVPETPVGGFRAGDAPVRGNPPLFQMVQAGGRGERSVDAMARWVFSQPVRLASGGLRPGNRSSPFSEPPPTLSAGGTSPPRV